jgi:transcription elongation factor GreA
MHHATQTQPQSPDYALTRAGLEALRAELEALRSKRTRMSDSATSEDEDRMFGKRIAALEEILAEAWIVDEASLVPGIVEIGTTIEFRDLESGDGERYRVVGKHEPLRPGELSAASAVGRALIGRRVGDTVTVELPNGRSRRLEVTEAEPAPPDG